MHKTPSDFDSEFGAYALSPLREFVRRLARVMPATWLGMRGASALRRLSLIGNKRGLGGPHDVSVANGVCARVYPASNRCEKRAFAGMQTWDAEERAALTKALENCTRSPFVFLDVGANVGFYSLFLNADAKRLGKELKIIAIEPDPENRARLMFNAAASNASPTIEAVAMSDQTGTGVLCGGETNRGGIHLSDTATIGGTEVPLETLASLVARHKLEHIDAMKVDIEGFDLKVLTAFFAQAPSSLFPDLLIVEIGKVATSPIVELALANGYRLSIRTKINAVLERAGA